MQMTPDAHAKSLGKLVTNFHSLETWVRIALWRASPNKDPFTRLDFEEMPVGTLLPANELVDYSDLGTLLRKFNAQMRAQDKEEIDLSLVELRDAIAHGRVMATDGGFPLRLFKFSRPDKNGDVSVTFNACLTPTWFERRIHELKCAIDTAVREAHAKPVARADSRRRAAALGLSSTYVARDPSHAIPPVTRLARRVRHGGAGVDPALRFSRRSAVLAGVAATGRLLHTLGLADASADTN
jgi:hypothetical protein